MPFSSTYQPRYAVYIVRADRHVLVGRYATLGRALMIVAFATEAGEMVYHDVN